MPLPFTVRRTDPDAAAFCARSGASDRAAVSAFVRGVKDLGLWENMVCWPLRSEQNAGTGTTAYSLGGLGTFNGTLTDGPVWTVDGIDMNASSSQRIVVGPSPFTDFVNGHSFWASIKTTGPYPSSNTSTEQWGMRQSGTITQLGQRGSGNAGGVFIGAYRTETTGYNSGFFNPNFTEFGAFSFDASIPLARYRVGTQAPTGGSGASINAYSGDLTIGPTIDGRSTTSMLMVFTPQYNLGAVRDSLESLYKSTLGTGLGLP